MRWIWYYVFTTYIHSYIHMVRNTKKHTNPNNNHCADTSTPIHDTNLKKFLWPHRILASEASEVGLGAAALAPSPRNPAESVDSEGLAHRHLGKRRWVFAKIHWKLLLGAQGAPKGPKGIPTWLKENRIQLLEANMTSKDTQQTGKTNHHAV